MAFGLWAEDVIKPNGGSSGGGGVFVVSHDGATLTKTFAEIKTALDSGQPVYFFDGEGSQHYNGFVLSYTDDPGGSGRFLRILRLTSEGKSEVETAYSNGENEYPYFDW